jgi:monoterpene epsilon-lactone hydrolase
VSTEQRENLEAVLRQSAFPADSDVNEQRRLLRELTSAQPLPADVTVTAAALGGVPTAEITVDGIEPRHVVLYFHGGVYVLGDAFQAADLASQVGRRTRAKVISVDYRLAPEHPYPAAVDDALAAYQALLHNGTAPSDIAFAGESAGGGLAIATLVNARDHGLPLPAAAFVMSPYADLTLAGTTMQTKREVDPLMSRENLQSRVTDYTAGQDAALGLISPIFADLSGLPPLIIQAGTHEVLLDDAVRLARQAATADVEVTLDITPRVPHVFQTFYPILDEAAAALDRAGQLLSAHLARAGAGFDRAAFHIDWDAQQVRCPKGHPSASWSACTQRGTQAVVVKFPAPLCQACPVRNQCTTTSRGGRQLTIRPRQVQQALDDARAEQTTDAFKAKYALRAGVEGTIHQAIAVADMRHARYRRLEKVHLQHVYAAIALNLIRLDAWWNGHPLDRTRTSHLTRLELALAA